MVFKCFDKTTGSGVSVNEQLAEDLHKPILKVYARLKDNIWAGDIAEMGSLSSKYRNVRYLLCEKCFH